MEDKITTIQYCSDLHLEFPDNHFYMEDHPIQPKADILIMAGDILPLSRLSKFDRFLDDISEKFQQVFWIPGNHEYYGGEIGNRSGAFKEAIRKNLFLLNNQRVDINGVDLIFTTLWSHLSEGNQGLITGSLNDFRKIRKDGRALTAAQYNAMHLENLQFLENGLENGPAKKVVITHHVPTLHNYPVKYLGDALNEAFAVDLGELMKKYAPSYWIYGHHHFNTAPFKIGETTLLSNQLGYVMMDEHLQFSTEAVLEL